jgi:hypothetical protein
VTFSAVLFIDIYREAEFFSATAHLLIVYYPVGTRFGIALTCGSPGLRADL